MSLTKNQFAEHFFKEISGLNYVYLNYTDQDPSNFPADHTADLLIDREDYAALLYVITSFPHLQAIRTKKEFRVQHIQLRFPDASAFSMQLRVAVMWHGRRLLNAAEVLSTAVATPEGIRVASPALRFDYFFQQAVLARKNMPPAYTATLKSLPEKERGAVFGHIVSRYRLVIHLLDDLFAYQRKYRLRLRRIIRHEKPNRWYFRHFAFIRYLYFRLANLVGGAWNEIFLGEGEGPHPQPIGNHLKAFLMKKSAG